MTTPQTPERVRMGRAAGPCVIAAMIAAALLAGPASGDGVKAIGRYKDWRVYTEQTGKDLVCYASTPAVDKAPKSTEHGDVDFYVASWKSGRGQNQPSLKVGYELRQDIPPMASIGNDRYRMYAAGPEAFFPGDVEGSFLSRLKKSGELRIEAARKDVRTAYHFSLKGAKEAMDKARALCR